jgi:hypothetical protein
MFVNELSVLCKRDEGSFNIVNLTYILLHFSDDTIEYGLLITRRAPEVYTVHRQSAGVASYGTLGHVPPIFQQEKLFEALNGAGGRLPPLVRGVRGITHGKFLK